MPASLRHPTPSWLTQPGQKAGQVLMRALDLILPPQCPFCREALAEPAPVCASCHEHLAPAPENLCLRCGAFAPGPVNGCRRCAKDPLAPDASYFAHTYQDPLTRLIIALKFSDRTELATPLGEMIWHALGESLAWEEPDLVAPVPLHTYRLLQRGYNQSALLAGVLARRLQRPLVTNALVRIRMTPAQTRLEPMERLGNQQEAYRADPTRVAGRAVLLVDDVVTTGATTRGVAAVLKQAGAKRVALVALARAKPRITHQRGDF